MSTSCPFGAQRNVILRDGSSGTFHSGRADAPSTDARKSCCSCRPMKDLKLFRHSRKIVWNVWPSYRSQLALTSRGVPVMRAQLPSGDIAGRIRGWFRKYVLQHTTVTSNFLVGEPGANLIRTKNGRTPW